MDRRTVYRHSKEEAEESICVHFACRELPTSLLTATLHELHAWLLPVIKDGVERDKAPAGMCNVKTSVSPSKSLRQKG